MKYLNHASTGIVVFLLSVASCASLSYTYYGVTPIEGESLKGTLLGKKPKDDLPLSKCDPTNDQKGKCVVMFVEEFERLMTDYETMKEKLENCAVQK